MDPEAPGQQRLSSWARQRTTTTEGCSLADGGSDLGKITSLQVVVRIKPDDHFPMCLISQNCLLAHALAASEVKEAR